MEKPKKGRKNRMNISGKFGDEWKDRPFEDYNEYMDYIFACVNYRLADYIEGLMKKYDAGQGNYKNVMYPDIQIAHNLCLDRTMRFAQAKTGTYGRDKEDIAENRENAVQDGEAAAENGRKAVEAGEESAQIDKELSDLLGAFRMSAGEENDVETNYGWTADNNGEERGLSIEEMMDFIDARLAVTDTSTVKLPFYELCRKLGFGHFTTFALAGAVLSSTQTSYAAVYQVVNENGSLTAPTVESTGRLYFGRDFSLFSAFQQKNDVMVDFLNVSIISSAGLRALLIGQKTAESKGGTMKLTNVNEMVFEVLAMTGFHKILTVE